MHVNPLAHGVDLVHMPRLQQVWQAHGDRFLERIYSAAERGYCLDCRDPLPRLAGRFAAKEAVLKVFGTGLRAGLNWTEIETLPDALGRPHVTLHGAAQHRACERGLSNVLISISHAGDYAIASAIGIGD